MRMCPHLAFIVGLWLLPNVANAVVCLRGGSVPMVGIPSSVNQCDVQYGFEDAFGRVGVFIQDWPSFSKSTLGRPQVGFWLHYPDDLESLKRSTRQIGSALDVAVEEFEGLTRNMICDGAYKDFLEAGGSIRVVLTALAVKDVEVQFDDLPETVQLIDVEIETPNDCEAP
jgi:hypothetical protein